MKYIEQIRKLMTQCKSIEELVDAIIKEKIPAMYMRLANEETKKEQGKNQDEIWHRFLVETGTTPVNKWENIINYSVVLISDDLRKIKVLK